MQDFLFKNVIIPAYFDHKNLKRFRYFELLEKRDKLSLEELKQLQWIKLKQLIIHCHKNIPYYTELFKNNDIHPNDIKNLKDYARIPELKKQDIKDNFDRLIDPRLTESQICYDSTSGSTGVPLQLVRSIEDQEYGFALRYRSNAWCGWNYWDKSAWFVSDTRHITQIDRWKGRMVLNILRRLVLNTKKITKENMFNWVKHIHSHKPEYIYGYSSLLGEFSHFLLDNDIEIKGVKGVFSTAEVLREREAMSKAFNAPVYNQYGASEVPCIAHECKKGNMHLSIDEILTEFVDIDDCSEIKKMIFTPLYIYGMPLLRYDLQDAAIPSVKQCDCGLPYPVIDLKVGRISDNFLSPTGKIVSGITFSWYVTDATDGIKQYQFVQHDLHNFELTMICDEAYRHKNEANIRHLMTEMLNTADYNLTFAYTDVIPPGKNGKYRPIISKVMENNRPQVSN